MKDKKKLPVYRTRKLSKKVMLEFEKEYSKDMRPEAQQKYYPHLYPPQSKIS